MEPPVLPTSFSDFCRRKILVDTASIREESKEDWDFPLEHSVFLRVSLARQGQNWGSETSKQHQAQGKATSGECSWELHTGELPGHFPQSLSCLGIPLLLPSLWDLHIGSGSEPCPPRSSGHRHLPATPIISHYNLGLINAK